MNELIYQVRDEGDLHRYRTEIPNIVFRLGLTPYELTLYAHLKQAAGDNGQCWKSTRTLARETGMSAGAICKAKDGLAASRSELSSKSLIVVRDESGSHGGRPRHSISLSDLWPENMAMRGKVNRDDPGPQSGPQAGPQTVIPHGSPSSPHELASSPHELASSPHELASSPHELASSPGELKKELFIKKERSEEEERPPSPKKAIPPGGSSPANSVSPVKLKKPVPVYLSPPTLEDVCDFCTTLGWPELAEEALDFQSQRGWQMKSGPVTDWPAALRTWKRNRDRYAAENGARQTSRFSTPLVGTPLVGGTLANAGHVQVKRPADWKPITLEEATRRDKEYAAQVAAKRQSEKQQSEKRQADALRNGS